jgi:hypothetical protein
VRVARWLALAFAITAVPCLGQKVIASTQTHGSSISLLNDSGHMTSGKSRYCIRLSDALHGEPMQATSVAIEFRQQVGKITERPSSFTLADESRGLYCAEIDLGKQYYEPSYYYVGIHFTDSSGNIRRSSFFLRGK